MNVVFDQVAKAFASRKKASSAASDHEVRLAVMVADTVDPALGAAVRAALTPQTGSGRLYIAGFGGEALPPVNGLSDAAVVLVGRDSALAAELCRSYEAAGVPCCALVENRSLAEAMSQERVDGSRILVASASDAGASLGAWLVQTLPDAAASLGACFPCCRTARADTVVLEATRNNALVGALAFLKEADMPVMMATEIAMMYKMADTYDLPLDGGRLKEVAAIVASSFGLRGIARLAVKALPLPGFLIKSGVAAAGTYAAGKALMAYYERLSAAPAPMPVEVVPGPVTTSQEV